MQSQSAFACCAFPCNRYTRKRGKHEQRESLPRTPSQSNRIHESVCPVVLKSPVHVADKLSCEHFLQHCMASPQQKHFLGISYQFDCQHLCVMVASHRLCCILQASCTGTAEVCNTAVSLAKAQCTFLPCAASADNCPLCTSACY